MATVTTEPSVSTPTTPRRASYLSPTKASLARSHPNLLTNNDTMSSTDPRRRRSSRRITASSQAEPSESTSVVESANLLAAGNLGTEIAGIFAHTEQDVVMDMAATDARPTTRSRPDLEELSERSPPSIVPKLVTSGSRTSRAQTSRHSNEPDLPPTPVQLGLAKPPDRPTGLASSSSPGGSGRRRVRVRGEKHTSSPLKPRAPAPVPSTSAPAAEEVASGVVEPEEDVQDDNDEMDEDVAESVLKEKQQQFLEFQQELKGLHDDFSKLQALFADVEKAVDRIPNTKLDALVDQLDVDQNYAADTEAVGLNEHPAFHEDPLAWLNLFAPGNLDMTSSTSLENKSQNNNPKLHHHIMLNAPAPWPSNVLNLTFDVVINVPEAQIDEIRVSSFPDYLSHRGRLRDWIQLRLDNPVHRLDLAGMVNAAGEYLVESIQRAKLVKHLYQLYPTSSPTVQALLDSHHTLNNLDLDGPVTTEQQAKELLPFLNSDTHVFTSSTPLEDNEQTQQIMLLYEIDLSWTGKAMTNLDITLQGVTPKPAEEARKLFRRIQAQSGPVTAFRGIWELLRLDRGEGSGEEISKTAKAVKGKRRVTQRFTGDM